MEILIGWPAVFPFLPTPHHALPMPRGAAQPPFCSSLTSQPDLRPQLLKISGHLGVGKMRKLWIGSHHTKSFASLRKVGISKATKDNSSVEIVMEGRNGMLALGFCYSYLYFCHCFQFWIYHLKGCQILKL